MCVSSAYQMRYTCVLNIRRPIHIHASMPVYNKLHHFHCERAQSFSASVREVSLPASVFEALVRAYPKIQIRSSTVAVKLCSRSVASSTLAAKLRVLSQQSLKSTRSLDRTQSFAATIVGASTHSSGLKLRYACSFPFCRCKTG